MASNGKKWFIGCGIGCGMVLLILGAVGTCGYIGIREIKEEAETYEASTEELEAEFGDAEDYTPPTDGTIASDRISTFLEVRQQTAETRIQLVDIFAVLDDEDGDKASVIDKIKSGMKLVPGLVKFIGERNHVLLENGMGSGEYQYIYTLSYFSFLKMDPSDGPPFQITGQDHEDGAVRWNAGVSSDDVVSDRANRVREHMHDFQLKILRNLIDAQGQPAENESAELTAWRAQLATELDTMRDETRRVLWEDSLPEQTKASLTPFMDELEASYAPLVNILEVGLEQ